MKLKIISVIIVVLMLAGIFAGFISDFNQCMSSVKILIKTDSGDEAISLYKDGEEYYAFLPSYADLNTASLESSLGYAIYLNGKEASEVGIEKDRSYNLSVRSMLGVVIAEEILTIKQSANIPALFIHIADGGLSDIHKDINTKKSGIIKSITANAKVDFVGSFKSLGGRGNSSWGQVKKPYSLEFTEKVDILGMGEAFTWVLIANAMDESNLRNKIVYETALQLGMDNSVESRFVDLYVDGEYLGLYLLTEQIEVSEERINITNLWNKTQAINQYRLDTYAGTEAIRDGVFQKCFSIPKDPDDISGGYLIEFELPDRRDHEYNLFTTLSGQDITVKSPKNASQAQMEYISTFVQKIENSLTTDEVFGYIDLESWARYYLIQEYFHNVSRTSYFFYKDSDSVDHKLYAGPMWDFDLSIGTNYAGQNTSPRDCYVNTWGWFAQLFQNQQFYNAVCHEYKSNLRPVLVDMLQSEIYAYAEEIAAAYQMNELRWKTTQYNWWVNRYDTQQHVEFIVDYLSERLQFMDELFSCETPMKPVDKETDADQTPEGMASTNPSVNTEFSVQQSSDTWLGTIKSMVLIAYYNVEFLMFCGMLLVVIVVIACDTLPVLIRRLRHGKNR